jgi:prevent-host-death family protein
MITKSIGSTQAQNNFGRILDDVTHNHARYVIERHSVPQVIILSFDDFSHLLSDKDERQQMDMILKELRPEYNLGRVLNPKADSE